MAYKPDRYYYADRRNDKVIKMPTDKQVEYANRISNFLDVPLPEEYTLDAYSDFIAAYAKEYKDQKEWAGK